MNFLFLFAPRCFLFSGFLILGFVFSVPAACQTSHALRKKIDGAALKRYPVVMRITRRRFSMTIKEIANSLGVSTATVSNVIHGHLEKMSPETAQLI